MTPLSHDLKSLGQPTDSGVDGVAVLFKVTAGLPQVAQRHGEALDELIGLELRLRRTIARVVQVDRHIDVVQIRVAETWIVEHYTASLRGHYLPDIPRLFFQFSQRTLLDRLSCIDQACGKFDAHLTDRWPELLLQEDLYRPFSYSFTFRTASVAFPLQNSYDPDTVHIHPRRPCGSLSRLPCCSCTKLVFVCDPNLLLLSEGLKRKRGRDERVYFTRLTHLFFSLSLLPPIEDSNRSLRRTFGACVYSGIVVFV